MRKLLMLVVVALALVGGSPVSHSDPPADTVAYGWIYVAPPCAQASYVVIGCDQIPIYLDTSRNLAQFVGVGVRVTGNAVPSLCGPAIRVKKIEVIPTLDCP